MGLSSEKMQERATWKPLVRNIDPTKKDADEEEFALTLHNQPSACFDCVHAVACDTSVRAAVQWKRSKYGQRVVDVVLSDPRC